MNTVLWIVQAVVALMFLAAGFPKLLQPIDGLSKRLAWVSGVPAGLVRFIGISEVIGAIGLILPGIAHFAPALTVAAALALALVMLLAMVFHIRRHEYSALFINVIILALMLFIGIGRVAFPL